MTYRVAVALGSNLGDRLEAMRGAVAALRELGEVEAVSSLYETAPVGGPEQAPYLNAVAVLSTDLEPGDLLGELLRVEVDAGRVRRERWGPRLLDLDLISAVDADGEPVLVQTEDLRLPHPRAGTRRFVLEPLTEVWPEVRLEGDVSVEGLLPSVADQEVEVLGTDWATRKTGAARALLAGQGLLAVSYVAGIVATGTRPGPDPVTVAGGAVALAGAGLAGWGVRSLGPALSPYPEPRPGTDLVEEGPYRLVRHPIYSGLVLGAAGIALATRSWGGMAVTAALGVFFSTKARYEESRMRVAVPGYAGYQRRVRGRLLPGTSDPT